MKCPVCGKAVTDHYRPFCSRRCADIDLSKWFAGTYAVPSCDPEDMREAAEAVEKEAQKPH